MSEQATEKVTIRLTEKQVEQLDAIAFRKGLRSRSEAIRQSVEEYIAEKKQDNLSEKIIIRYPIAILTYLDSMIDAGEILSREEGLLEAAKLYKRSNEDYYLKEWPKIQEHRQRALEQRKARIQVFGGE